MWVLAQSFGLGLLIGSFLNVVIHRLPRGESVAHPRSRCPACATPIAARDNIPLLSFLLLRGRCRHCRARIPARYPLVEFACGAAFAFIVAAHGPTLLAALLCCFAALLIASAGIDYDEQWIPDRCSLGGLLLGLGAMPLAHALAGTPYAHALAHSARGALVGAGVLWSVGFVHARVCALLGRRFEHWPGAADADANADADAASVADAPFPRPFERDYWLWFPGLGLGDVKLLAMVGAFLGARGALWTLFGASLGAALLGFLHMRAHGDAGKPFGFAPAIALAALVVTAHGVATP